MRTNLANMKLMIFSDGFTNHLLIKTTPPPQSVNFNSYEMSMSQQRRSQQQQQQPMAPPLSDCWGSGAHDGGVLHKNADGAYYIPSGSCEFSGKLFLKV